VSLEEIISNYLIITVILILMLTVASFYFLKKRGGIIMTAEEQIEYLGTKEALKEASHEAFKVYSEGNYEHSSHSEYQANITTQGLQLGNYLIEKFNNKVQDIINVLNSLKNKINVNLETRMSSLSSDSIYLSINSSVIEDRSDIKRLDDARKEAEHNLKVFKGKYNITRPVVEQNTGSTFYVLGFFIILESIANIYFYHEQFNVIMSWLIAIAISLMNVTLAYWFGNKFRNINIPEKAFSGWMFFVFNAIIVLGIMGIVSWFRLAENQEIRLIFDTAILFIIGIFFNAYAMVKGYNSDDPFPEYGRLSRLKDNADSEYFEFIRIATKKTVDLFDLNDKKFIELKDSIKSSIDTAYKKLAEGENLIDITNNDYKSLTKKIQALNDSFKGVFKSLLRTGQTAKFLEYNFCPIPESPTDEKSKILSEYKNDYEQYRLKSQEFLSKVDSMHSEYHKFRIDNQESILTNLRRLD